MRARLDQLPLFVYGTLLFDEVVEPLLGRLPRSEPAVLQGHQARRLPDVVWPGLILQVGESVVGRVFTDLTPGERVVLDDYEDEYYDLVAVNVALDAADIFAATYRVPRAMVAPEIWTPEWFSSEHLGDFVAGLSL